MLMKGALELILEMTKEEESFGTQSHNETTMAEVVAVEGDS
jgi:hypothetical protein